MWHRWKCIMSHLKQSFHAKPEHVLSLLRRKFQLSKGQRQVKEVPSRCLTKFPNKQIFLTWGQPVGFRNVGQIVAKHCCTDEMQHTLTNKMTCTYLLPSGDGSPFLHAFINLNWSPEAWWFKNYWWWLLRYWSPYLHLPESDHVGVGLVLWQGPDGHQEEDRVEAKKRQNGAKEEVLGCRKL